jgi:hypothetical protein
MTIDQITPTIRAKSWTAASWARFEAGINTSRIARRGVTVTRTAAITVVRLRATVRLLFTVDYLLI